MTKESFKQFMLTYLHKPYIWGGDDPINGLDCSGLVQELLASMGMDPLGDQTADALYRHFGNIPGTIRNRIDTGSLVFYGTVSKITHVGMIYEGMTMLEAGGGGSKTLTEKDAIVQNAFIRLRPYTSRSDMVAVLYPDYKWTK